MPEVRILALLVFALANVWPAAAQEQEARQTEQRREEPAPAFDDPDDSDEEIDEVVVIYRKGGDPVDLDAQYEDRLRLRLLDEMGRMRTFEEETAWREGDSAVEKPSRIRWGYDAERELAMRQQSDFMDLPMNNTRPATLFRVEF